MKRFGLLAICGLFVLGLCANNVFARAQYKTIVDKMDASTDAEKAVQAAVKADKCNHCHVKGKSKKMRTEYGMKLHAALGGGDKEKYKYDKEFWKKGDDGDYSAEAVKMVRDAINAAAKDEDK